MADVAFAGRATRSMRAALRLGRGFRKSGTGRLRIGLRRLARLAAPGTSIAPRQTPMARASTPADDIADVAMARRTPSAASRRIATSHDARAEIVAHFTRHLQIAKAFGHRGTGTSTATPGSDRSVTNASGALPRRHPSGPPVAMRRITNRRAIREPMTFRGARKLAVMSTPMHRLATRRDVISGIRRAIRFAPPAGQTASTRAPRAPPASGQAAPSSAAPPSRGADRPRHRKSGVPQAIGVIGRITASPIAGLATTAMPSFAPRGGVGTATTDRPRDSGRDSGTRADESPARPSAPSTPAVATDEREIAGILSTLLGRAAREPPRTGRALDLRGIPVWPGTSL